MIRFTLGRKAREGARHNPIGLSPRGGSRLLALLLALLCLPTGAFAASLQRVEIPWADQLAQVMRRDHMSYALELLMARMPERKKGARIEEWYLHEKGFAFRVPENMELYLRYQGREVMLMDAVAQRGVQRASISISITDVDGKLDTIAAKDVQNVFASRLRNFELVRFARHKLSGMDCIAVSFLAESSPRLLFVIYMFEMHDQYYVIMLCTERNIRNVLTDLGKMESFCQSLLFAQKEALELGRR